MLVPQFPYIGNQIVVSSGRVLLHSKSDAVFIFGKQGVGISTPATLNIDAPERVIVHSDKIELGLRAETEGEPLLKGTTTLKQLSDLLDVIVNMGDALEKMAVEGLPSAVPAIKISGGNMRDIAKRVKAQLNNKALSTVTYTL